MKKDILKSDKKIILSKTLQEEMMKFFLKTSIPRILQEKKDKANN